jgi:potassium-dependent mechanosensitive channel
MPTTAAFRIAHWLPLLACGLLAWATASAQQAAEARGAAPIAPIPAPQLPGRADADEQFAREARQRTADVARRGRELADRLDAIAAAVGQVVAAFPVDRLDVLPISRIESLQRQWQFQANELERWRIEQQQVLDGLSEDAAQLAERRVAWLATRRAAADLAVPESLVSRIDAVVGLLGRTEQALAVPVGEQIELRRRASGLQARVEAGQRAVQRAATRYDARLWRVDAPPYWQAWRDPSAARGAVAAANDSVGVDLAFLDGYFAASRHRVLAHGLFALLSLPLLLWVGARSRRRVAADPALQPAGPALTRPVSAWLVLVLVGGLVFEPDAPTAWHEAVLLLSLVPVLRLLPRGVFQTLGYWPYAATALYLLQRLGFALLGNPFWYRTHLLVLTLLTLGALGWLLLQPGPAGGAATMSAAQRRLRRAVRAAGWVGMAALVVALLVNLAGNVSLAEVLTRGTLGSSYLGLALYAGATVLNSLLGLVFTRGDEARPAFAATPQAGALLRSLSLLVYLVAGAAWVISTLYRFRVYQPVADGVSAMLSLRIEAGNVAISLGSVLLFAVAVSVAFWIARTTRAVLRDELLPRTTLPYGVASSVSNLTYYALILLGLLVALSAAGFEVSQLTLVIGALGVGIGLGLQDVVRNFVSGLILMFERPVEPGHTVDVAGVSGRVREIGMRATTIRGFEGSDIVVPNGMLLSEKLVNWTLSDRNRRLDVDVGVAYGTDPRQVIALLTEAARASPGIVAFPEPVVLFLGFGASSLDFSVRAWTDDFDRWLLLRSELALRVHDALRDAGIEIPFPQRDLHLRSVSAEAAERIRSAP